MSLWSRAGVLGIALGACTTVTNSSSLDAKAPAPSDAQPSAGCARRHDDHGDVWSVDSGGASRSFTVHIPPQLPRPAPLVLSFHGYRNFPLFQKALSQLNVTADRAGFVVVYPKGSGTPLSFNGLGCCGSAFDESVDDVAFTDAMLDMLERELCIDRSRVYVTGFSNGGFMAQRLACERADRFAAAASVAGLLDPKACAPTRPISVLEIHGTADDFVPYAGQPGRYVSAEQAFAFWARADGCNDDPQPGYSGGDASCERHAHCAAGAEVALCTIAGGGHTWPGGLDNFLIEHIAGKVSRDLSASDAIWAFFERHSLPQPRAGAALAAQTGNKER
jgi:polyhydroxybutyrate depolymerase